MSERLIGPRTKFERAKEHFDQLHSEIRAFFDREPYKVVSEVNPETGDEVYRVRVVEQPPPRFAAMVGDIVHNLRSSLDLLAWQLVEAGGGSPGDQTMFPIRKTRQAFETAGLAQVKGASREAIRVLSALKPYDGGNAALWRLHRLDANDKQRLLTVVGAAYKSFRLSFDLPWVFPGNTEPTRVPGLDLIPADRLFPLVDGEEVFGLPATTFADTPLNPKMQFTFHIAISDGEVVHGDPLIPTLNDLGRAVDEIIDLFAPLLD